MIALNLGGGLQLQVPEDRAAELHRELGAALGAGRGTSSDSLGGAPSATLVLPTCHPMWEQHSGGDAHRGHEWDPETDLPLAEAFYGGLKGKSRQFLDLLIDNPGRLLTPEDFVELSDGVFTSSRSVAGTINGLLRPHQRSGRRYPFSWWAGEPTRYAMKPSVAGLFDRARNAGA